MRRNGGLSMKYGIAIFPSDEIQAEANAYRKRYDPKYTLIKPHITVKPAFSLQDLSLDTFIQKLTEIAKDVKPFTITISKIRSFAPVTYTIFFKVDEHESLTYLHEKMHEKPFTTKRDHPFVPHITIGQNLAEDEFSDIFGSLRMKDIYFEYEVDKFHLMHLQDDGSWKIHETFHLG